MTADDHEALRARLRRIEYCERVTRILARRSGIPEGFVWPRVHRVGSWKAGASHRTPPLPFHATIHKGAGTCRVCGQPIYGGGSFRSFAGPLSKRLTWHNVCTTTYFVMTKPSDYAAALILRQGEACAITREPIRLPYVPENVDVDHEVPLFRVAREHAGEPWHELLRFWMTGNLRAITHAAHLVKNQAEARERAGARSPQPALL